MAAGRGARHLANDDDEVESFKSVAIAVHIVGCHLERSGAVSVRGEQGAAAKCHASQLGVIAQRRGSSKQGKGL